MLQTHFLLVDDDEVFCSILSRSLERRGENTTSAHSIDQAIALCNELPAGYQTAFSHAVLDLNMGKESGLSLIPLLLQINSDLKIIVLTGYSSIATTVEAMKRGAVNYLCKPASAEEILQAFEESNTQKSTLVDTPIKQPSVDRLEWEYIQKTLAANAGNISATARVLGMYRRTLQRKLKKKPVQC